MPSAEMEVRDNCVTDVTLPTIDASKGVHTCFQIVMWCGVRGGPGPTRQRRFHPSPPFFSASKQLESELKQVCVQSTPLPTRFFLFFLLASLRLLHSVRARAITSHSSLNILSPDVCVH